MRRSVRQLPAPTIVEASSSRGSIARKDADRSRKVSGTISMEWTQIIPLIE